MPAPIPPVTVPERFRIAVLTAVPIGAVPIGAVAAPHDIAAAAFEMKRCDSPEALGALLAAGDVDALLVDAKASADTLAVALAAAHDTAVLIVSEMLDTPTLVAWLQRGAQDVLLPVELRGDGWPLRLRAAIERKHLERESRTVYSTDLDTGLPHQQQFIEHVSQLLALRAREPAPMAVLVLRVEGFTTAESRFGREAANALRRKVGVRLRAGVRASDVVASLGDDGFGVLLGSILSPDDAERVGAKLLQSLQRTFIVSAQDVTIATALGIAHYPADGAQPEALLRRALGLAAGMDAEGRSGFSNFDEAGGAMPAANDD